MTSRIESLSMDLKSARERLNAVLDRVGERWETQVYSDGLQWTVRQLVAHLVDADQGHNAQAMNIAQGKDIIPEDFDIERYNAGRTKKNAGLTAEQARTALQEAREQLTQWLHSIDDSVLDHKGRHATLKILSVEAILKSSARHERTHADDIANALNIKVGS